MARHFSGFFVVSMISVFGSYFLKNALNDKVRYLSFMGAAYLLYDMQIGCAKNDFYAFFLKY